MGMMAAKHTDLVVGMDMHMIQPPPPAPPVMVPHPVAGMIMDPADYSPGACTVFINGLPRARAGTMCMMCPPHIPIGGMFVKPPLSEAEVYQGSSTVTADGEAMSAMSHQVLGCHDIGAPAPVRKWKSGGAKSLMKAGSVVIAIPAGAPVFVGGAPTTSASSAETSEHGADWLVVEVVDVDGAPMTGIAYEIELADGSTRQGVVSDEGAIELVRLPPGSCKLQLRGFLDEVRCSTGTKTCGSTSIQHVVRSGEDIETIVARHSIGSKWREVYDAAENETLREACPDPYALAPGLTVHLDSSHLERFELPTMQAHRVEVRPSTTEVRVLLRRPRGSAYASADFEVKWAGQLGSLTGTTGDDGVARFEAPRWVERAVLLVVARTTATGVVLRDRFEFLIGGLPPAQSASGELARLRSLGMTRKREAVGAYLLALRDSSASNASNTRDWVDALVRMPDGDGTR